MVTLTRTVERTVCPAALEQPIEARPVRPAGSLTASSPELMGWVAAMLARVPLLEAVIGDAQAECRAAEVTG